MSDSLPSLDPQTPETPSPLNPKSGLSRRDAAGAGLVLFLFSVLFGLFTYGIAFIIGFVIALCSLACPGYRYIFVGFILSTIITVGVLLLILTIACSNMRM